MGDPERALELGEQARKLDPANSFTQFVGGWAMRELGDIAQSTATLERGVDSSGGDPWLIAHVMINHLHFGDAAKGKQLLAELKDRSEREQVTEMAFYLAARVSGDIAAAIEWLRKAHDAHDVYLPWMRVLPFDAFGFADEPRIEAFFDEIGLP